MIAALLSTGMPLALLLLAARGDLSYPGLLAVNLAITALPHWLLWWLAAKRGESRSAEFYGGLAGANAVLVFYTSSDAAWLWIVYWPLAAVGILVGHAVTEAIMERWRSRRIRGEV